MANKGKWKWQRKRSLKSVVLMGGSTCGLYLVVGPGLRFLLMRSLKNRKNIMRELKKSARIMRSTTAFFLKIAFGGLWRISQTTFLGSGSFFFVNPLRVYKSFGDLFSPVECAALDGVYLDARLGFGVLCVPHDRDRAIFLKFADFLLCREEKTAAVAV